MKRRKIDKSAGKPKPDNVPNDGDGANQREAPVFSPFLVIRNQMSDLGLRPLPKEEFFWISPDIWVESSDPTGNPVVGEENFIHAVIWNFGLADGIPVDVDFYWNDPALVLAPPFTHMGTESRMVPAGEFLDVRCATPWIPEAVDEGHRCLIVNCDSWPLNPILYPYQARLDAHCGQRNVEVVKAGAGGVVNFSVLVQNPFDSHVSMKIMASINRFTVVTKDLEIRELINQLASYSGRRANSPEQLMRRFRATTGEARIAREFATIRGFRPTDSGIRRVPIAMTTELLRSRLGASGNRHSPRDRLDCQLDAFEVLASPDTALPDSFLLHEVTMVSGEVRNCELELAIPPESRAGDFLVMHVIQQAGRLTAGGYTVVVIVLD